MNKMGTVKNLLLLIFSVLCSFAQAQISVNDIALELLFDGAVKDSYSEVDIVNHGAVLTANQFGFKDRALHFNGTGNYLQLPNIVPTDSGAISYWVKPADESAQIHVYTGNVWYADGFGEAGSNVLEFHTGIYAEKQGTSGFYYIYENGPGVLYKDTVRLVLNQWYHVALSYNVNDSIYFYINGELRNKQSMKDVDFANAQPTFTRIGRPGGSKRYLNGDLDNLRIFKRPISEREVQALYNELYFVSIHDTVTVVDTIKVSVTDTLIIDLATFIHDSESQWMKVYPNPAKNYLMVDINNPAALSSYGCRIVSAGGDVVKQEGFDNTIEQLFIGDLTPGMYLFQIVDKSNSEVKATKKIIIQ